MEVLKGRVCTCGGFQLAKIQQDVPQYVCQLLCFLIIFMHNACCNWEERVSRHCPYLVITALDKAGPCEALRRCLFILFYQIL